MLEHRPVRRDPRVLALRATPTTIHFAAMDAWEVRGLGSLPCRSRREVALAITRIVLQCKPSVILVVENANAITATIERVAKRRGLPVIRLDPAERGRLGRCAPSLSELAAAYPELPTHSTDMVVNPCIDLLALAAASLVHLDLPPRRYASSRQPARPASTVVSGRSRCHRSPRVPHGQSDRLRGHRAP